MSPPSAPPAFRAALLGSSPLVLSRRALRGGTPVPVFWVRGSSSGIGFLSLLRASVSSSRFLSLPLSFGL
jgi:hypothetical protein